MRDAIATPPEDALWIHMVERHDGWNPKRPRNVHRAGVDTDENGSMLEDGKELAHPRPRPVLEKIIIAALHGGVEFDAHLPNPEFSRNASNDRIPGLYAENLAP